MKNKFQMIDINIASTYMGRFMTLGVTAIVLAITVSALTGRGGLRTHQPVELVVPSGTGDSEAEARFGPLQELLTIETGRNVRAHARAEQWCDDCDLFVMPISEFLSERRSRELVPLYSIEAVERGRDAAVLIARAGASPQSPLEAADLMFTHPRSLNGCWVQLSQLEAEGFRAPQRLDSLRFAPAPAPGAGIRVVYSVATGHSAMGACRASDILDAVKRGGIGPGELTVVRSSPAVPEVVLACRPRDADYYRGVLARAAARMAAPETEGRAGDAVELLQNRGMRSLLPISDAELERVAALHEEMEARVRTARQ